MKRTKTPKGPLPKLFLGSSSESLPVASILKDELTDVADVVLWADSQTFPATKFLANSLLKAASNFDFGVFLFEPDDRVQSRSETVDMPRDNVVFELGLFVSHLGLERAFPMVPRGRVKILSDLDGFQPIVYDESEEAAELKRLIAGERNELTRRAQIASLKGILGPSFMRAVERIRQIVRQHGHHGMGVVSAHASNVATLASQLSQLIRESPGFIANRPVSVRHWALDMGEFSKPLIDEILHDRSKLRNLQWRCLVIDPDSAAIKNVASRSVDAATASSQVERVRLFLSDNAEMLNKREIRFECKLYHDPPMMHGFLINGVALLWSMCNVRDGKLDGDNTPYWRFEAARDALMSCHPANSFRNWFDHCWQHRSRDAWASKPVNLNKESSAAGQ